VDPEQVTTPPATATDRALQMLALREQGLHLDEIARRFRVSGERVRQILGRHGGPESGDVAAARRCRDERLAEARVDELLALWRAGEDPRTVAGDRGLQAAACRATIERFATDVDRRARRANLAGARRSQTFSDRDIIRALTAAAANVGHAPSGREYASVARELGLPSLATVLNRMGGWSNATAAAGLRPAPAGARTQPRRWTEVACWDALRRAATELGEIPSVAAYETCAAGRADLPSAATIRIRLGRWSLLAARLAADRALAEDVHARPPSRQPVLATA
jgi:hypothetical protein